MQGRFRWTVLRDKGTNWTARELPKWDNTKSTGTRQRRRERDKNDTAETEKRLKTKGKRQEPTTRTEKQFETTERKNCKQGQDVWTMFVHHLVHILR